jgi:hypothetical protein
MATKAERFKAEQMREHAGAARSTRRPRAPKEENDSPAKPHNLGARAGRHANVQYEASATTPSRKSTRRSQNHLRAATQLERTEKLLRNTSKGRATTAKLRSVHVSGKPRRAV